MSNVPNSFTSLGFCVYCFLCLRFSSSSDLLSLHLADSYYPLRFTLNFIYTKESLLGSQAQARYLSSVLQWHPIYLSIKMLITPHYSLELFLRYSYKILEDMVLFYSSSFYFIVIFSSRNPIQFLAIGGAQ